MEEVGSTGQSRFSWGLWPSGALDRWLRILLLLIAATVVILIGWAAIGPISHVIFLFLASVLFAYLIGPIVDRLAGRMRRGAAIGLVFIVLLALASLLLVLFLGPTISQLRALAAYLAGPSAAQSEVLANISAFLNEHGISIVPANLVSQLAQLLKGASDTLLNFILGVAGNLVSLGTDVLIILAVTFFLSVDGRGLNVRILRLMTDSFREHVLFVEATISRVVGGYFRAQLLIASIYALLAGGGSWVLGVDHALFIGIAAFFLEFLPLVGPVISMVIAVIISLFQPWPLVIWVTLYFIFIQQLESNVLEPRIGGRILGLHAVVVITAVIAGAGVAGILGAFLALPVVSAFTTLGLALYLDIRCRTDLLLPSRGSAVQEVEANIQKRDAGAGASLPSEPSPTPETVAVAESDPNITQSARDAALMFKDRLDFVLEEQNRLRASYEQIAAQQSAKERQAHGLA